MKKPPLGQTTPKAVGSGPKVSPRAALTSPKPRPAPKPKPSLPKARAIYDYDATDRKAHAPPKPRPAPKPSLPKARAIYDYDAADVDELQLKVGDIVMITKKDASGWWQGKKAGKEGLFPGNYAEMI